MWWSQGDFMAHNRRGRGGFRMEGRDNDNNDMEGIRRMIQQLADLMARIENQNMDDESFDGEQEDNPFHHRAPLGESDERGRGGRPFNNDTARYFDMKVEKQMRARYRRIGGDDFEQNKMGTTRATTRPEFGKHAESQKVPM
ncbi:hypothetical protein LWI29_023941 [Acer saccharum]|uniref:Uncharacterized protein n=1 Tax=Acer saccharum TaxID=4024 RepID=A0AA39RI59_ACESA|nr:hypothetical protein LWI29_023941 [Acer saccharum]